MTLKKLNLVPRLRFPEYRDEGQWELEALGSVCNLYQSETLSASELNQEGPYLVYGANGIIGKHDRYNHEDSKVTLTCRGASCGEVNRTKPKSWITGNAMIVESKSGRIDEDFVFHSLKSERLKSVISGSAQPQITRAGLSPYKLTFPESKNEQLHIADCLSSLDDVTAAEDRKLEVLRKHKQGLMQQLFPQPGETVPRLRFPEFADAPQWQISTFGERCESFSGSTPDTSKENYYGGTIPFIRSAEIGRDETEIFLTKEGLENSAAKMVKRGDLLVALYGANSGDTALARVHGAINQAIICLRSADSAPYLCQFLTARKNWIITTYLQGGQGNLSGQIVLQVPLCFPHKDEQQKIADCLGSLDDLIETKDQNLEALRQHKKGLLQQLFPSLETG
ncbi:MAG: restriction endonuclease subunit S [Gammaproteobacteria bacterium]|nr:restriction endonuclease subunit S [Gammaproteobacteria bacterium]MYF00325.1 restriction endonuclease subunit S [Gammaproteobacteria bacterium]